MRVGKYPVVQMIKKKFYPMVQIHEGKRFYALVEFMISEYRRFMLLFITYADLVR